MHKIILFALIAVLGAMPAAARAQTWSRYPVSTGYYGGYAPVGGASYAPGTYSVGNIMPVAGGYSTSQQIGNTLSTQTMIAGGRSTSSSVQQIGNTMTSYAGVDANGNPYFHSCTPIACN